MQEHVATAARRRTYYLQSGSSFRTRTACRRTSWST